MYRRNVNCNNIVSVNTLPNTITMSSQAVKSFSCALVHCIGEFPYKTFTFFAFTFFTAGVYNKKSRMLYVVHVIINNAADHQRTTSRAV